MNCYQILSISEVNNCKCQINTKARFYRLITPKLKKQLESTENWCYMCQELLKEPKGIKLTWVKLFWGFGFVLGWNPKEGQPIFCNIGAKNNSDIFVPYDYHSGFEIIDRLIYVER